MYPFKLYKSLYRKFLIDWIGFIGLFNLTNTIIHLRSLMDRFKIFPCVPVYGDSPSYEYAKMKIPSNLLPDKNYQLSAVAF